MKNKEIEEMIQNRIEDIYQSGEYIYQAKELEEILSYIEQLEKENDRLKEVVENLTTMTVNGDTKQIKNTAQYKLEQLENKIDKAIELLGNYKHYSTPTEEQNRENEDIADNAYNILKGDSDYE